MRGLLNKLKGGAKDPGAGRHAAAFRWAGDQHRMQALAVAAQYLHACGFLAGGAADADAGELRRQARFLAYSLRAQAAGWAAFCARHGVPADFLDAAQFGRGVLDQAERYMAGEIAPPFTQAEAVEYRASAGAPADVPTAEVVLADLSAACRAMIDQRGQ
jgi:hypothetical protein